MSPWILAQVVVDVLLLVLLLSILRSKGREQSRTLGKENKPDSHDSADREHQHKAHLEDLQASLESLVERVEQTVGESLVSLDASIERAEKVQAQLSETVKNANSALNTTGSSRVLDSGASARRAESPESSAAVSAKQAHAQSIVRLRDQGASVDEIAKTLNIGRGEVHLVLDMHRVGQGK